MTSAETIERPGPPLAEPGWTSVPHWPDRAPALDGSGRCYVLVAVGAGAAEVVEDWCAQAADLARPARVVHLPEPGPAPAPGDPRAVLAALADSRVGTRVAVAGDEADVLEVATWCRRAGVLPEELLTHATSRATIAVFCVHCEQTQRVSARPGGNAACRGCGARLEVHEHASGHRGSYLASATAAAVPATAVPVTATVEGP